MIFLAGRGITQRQQRIRQAVQLLVIKSLAEDGRSVKGRFAYIGEAERDMKNGKMPGKGGQ